MRHTFETEVARKAGVETGGVLVGFSDSRLDAFVVTAASGPGPKSRHTRHSFNRDREFCQAFLDRHASASEGCVDFLGEWHSHPEPDPHPSPTDASTYRALAASGEANTPQPVVLIVGTEPVQRRGRRPTEMYLGVNGFLFQDHGLTQRPIRWLVDGPYLDLLLGDV
ncbi:MAG: Mov34/MPN/PAD-1 family protein [Gemmatimonadaceae bacterium]|nr:Mov34/MPN/PAD-1 family protein [Gemmatimonadaceae bacterium]MCW5826343.1 Mov34/MPN/PAD-1 family protein [Gemmatimonadaceae bacterium]